MEDGQEPQSKQMSHKLWNVNMANAKNMVFNV